MEKKSSSKSANDQRNSEALEQMREHMGNAGFVAGSQIPYVRELGRFAAKLDRKGLDEATVDGDTVLQQAGDTTAVKTDLERICSSGSALEKVMYPLIPDRKDIVAAAQAYGFVQQKDDGVDPRRKSFVFQAVRCLSDGTG